MNINKAFIFGLFIIFTLLKENLFEEIEYVKDKTKMIIVGRKYGYDLTNPNDAFFLDICETFYYEKKDVSLDYKRKYFFFPEDKDKTHTFIYPMRNTTYSCFYEFFEINNYFTNISIFFIFTLFLFQINLLSVFFFISKDESFYNTPSRKRELLSQYKFFCFCKKFRNKKKLNFSKFVPESSREENLDHNTLTNLKIGDNDKNSKLNKDEHIPYVNKEKDIDDKEDSAQNLKAKSLNNICIDNNIIKIKEKDLDSKATADFNNHKKDNINIENKIDQLMVEDNNTIKYNEHKEKSYDNYSFGNNIQNKFNIQTKVSTNENRNQKLDDRIKRREYIYNSINKIKVNDDKNKDDNINININNSQNFQLRHINMKNIEYVREEYFYFGYLLAIIEDKRNIYEIYCDLLEQCQIIFKFFLIPFNIYEDRKLQIIYYSFKIQTYFLFNCLLIKAYVINNIFDNKHFFIHDLIRSIKISFYTYIICLFFNNLINIKNSLLKRKFKISNLRIYDNRINTAIYKTTYTLCMDHLFDKMIILTSVIFFYFIYTFYMCFSFGAVYKYTQFYVIKGVILSIFISQISPFIFCWIPSCLRHKSIEGKNEKLYKINRLIELLFID